MRKILTCLFALLLVTASATNGQELLLDINREGLGSDPRHLLATGNQIFFRASQAETGRELWVSDGTEAGTRLVKDIVPGIEGSFPTPQVTIGEDILFTTDNPHAIWRTDGTDTGTGLLNDFGDGRLAEFVSIGSQVFFGFFLGNNRVWWVTDGTEENTHEVFGPGFQWPENTSQLTAFRDSLFFITYDRDRGTELWKMHPEEASPIRVFGKETTQPSTISVVGEHLYVIGWEPNDLYGLWLSDGTVTGTTFMTDIMETSRSWISIIGLISDKLIFLTDDGTHGFQPWVSDGTPEGTMLLADIGEEFWDPRVIGDRMFFVVHDSAVGTELWTTDGTPEGTHIVKDINPGAANSSPFPLVAIDNRLLFTAYDDIHGRELWISDGTGEGTYLVLDFVLGTGSSSPADAVIFNDHVFLTFQTLEFGEEMWKIDLSVFITATETSSVTPYGFSLSENYPNPFIERTTIRYTTPFTRKVQIEVFDLLGKRVRILSDGYKSSGEYEVTFDATGLSTGVYFYTLTAGNFTQTRKMVVVR